MAEGEDPFHWLIKRCQPTSSQELKFQSYSFGRGSEELPGYFNPMAIASAGSYRLEPVGIVFASPPETESQNNAPTDKNDTEEKEEFLPPPGHRNPSTSYSQKDPQRLRAVKRSVSEVTATVVAKTTAGDGERVTDEASVDFEKGEITLGFSGGQCSDSVKGFGEIEGFERGLKRCRIFDTKLDKTNSRKIRVSEENWDSEMRTVCIDWMKIDENVNDCEMIDLETEKIDEAGEFYVGKITTDGEDDTANFSGPSSIRGKEEKDMGGEEHAGRYVKVKKDGSWKDLLNIFDAVFGKLDDDALEKGEKRSVTFPEPRWSECKITTNVDTPADDTDKVREPGESWENVQTVSDATTESVEEAGKSGNCGSDADVDNSKKQKCVGLNEGDKCLKVNGNLVREESEEGVRDNSNNEDGTAVLGSSRKYRCGRPGNGVEGSSVKERVARSRHILTSSIKEKDMGGDKNIRNTEEVDKSKNSGSCNDINQREKDQDVSCIKGDKYLRVNGTLALAEFDNGIGRESNNKEMQRDNKFGYEGPCNGVDHSATETVPRIRRVLPSSIRGKDKKKVMGGEENGSRYVKVKKNGSWKVLVDALQVVFGKVADDNGCNKPDILETAKVADDNGCNEPDFLKTAEKKGLTFPERRWSKCEITTDGDTPADDTEKVREPGDSLVEKEDNSDVTFPEPRWSKCKITTDGDTPEDDTEKVREAGESWENVQKVSDATAESVEEAGKSGNCGSDGDVDHSKKEKCVDLNEGAKCLKVNGNLVWEESEAGVRDNSNNEDGTAVLGSGRKYRYGRPGNGVEDSGVKERVVRRRLIWTSSINEKDLGGDKSIRNTEEVDKSKNSDSCNDINPRGKNQHVSCNKGDKCLRVNGNLALVESENGIRQESNNKEMQRDNKFGYEGPCNGVDHSATEKVPRNRRVLPSSIRGKEKKDMGEGEENGSRYVKVNKNVSWKDLLDAFDAFFGKVADNNGRNEPNSSVKAETTFPQPRWV
ncbi:hypothetical protein M9H77_24715 [Catharanthus roseus]|uniref:Uncharacterized protein n=1 Tax=Catharanthus roseus TaxID=4058 RepID=A0ACC0A7J8_CATRO|nr:hypothetical protein M9H77_24715 [Catharanthus roseus]